MPEANTNNGPLLAITAIGPAREHISLELIRSIQDRDGILRECRIQPLGNSICAQFLVAGNWSALARLESALPTLGERLGMRIDYERTDENKLRSDCRPYGVEVIAPQRDDLLVQVLQFFKSQDVHLSETVLQNYESSHTRAAMSNLQFIAHVPVNQHPQSLRESFMDLCDDLNADGLLDPIKS